MGHLYDVIIIGGGAAGLFCGAQLNSLDTLVLEKMECVGKKILVSGGGQCNYTHTGELKVFQEKYGDQTKFVSHVLKSFSNSDLILYFKKNGLESFTRDDGKVFPKSLKATDVVEFLKNKNKKIRCNTAVTKVKYDGNYYIKTSNGEFECHHLVIATGGNSYASLGSSGDGYILARMLGHRVTKISPALTPIWIKTNPFKTLMGMGLKSVEISIWEEGKVIKRHVGDIGFTHFGLSGPAIIDASRYMGNSSKLSLNLLYENFRSFEQLESFLICEFEKNSKKQLHNFLKILKIPERLLEVILAESG
ncbi:MAG: aminoacetone oxidase family FAD-binding enzyme, partial [Fusobacteria bacterium]|nr:aminoacetone oxidase family FAD-binding enzyme [Fusobacteriota bacterium]